MTSKLSFQSRLLKKYRKMFKKCSKELDLNKITIANMQKHLSLIPSVSINSENLIWVFWKDYSTFAMEYFVASIRKQLRRSMTLSPTLWLFKALDKSSTIVRNYSMPNSISFVRNYKWKCPNYISTLSKQRLIGRWYLFHTTEAYCFMEFKVRLLLEKY